MLPASKIHSKCTAKEVFVARQAIYDRSLNIYGYELLYRSSQENRAVFVHSDTATAETLLNAYCGVGLDQLLEGQHGFVNLPREYLVGDLPLPTEPPSLVLEVLEDVEIDEEVLRGLECLSQKGFTIALDDVVFHSKLRSLLLGVAGIVKLDIRQLPKKHLAEHVQEFRKYRARLLAEKIETEEEFEDCMRLGFDLFQGYFLSKPNVFSPLRPPIDDRVLHRLNASLMDFKSNIDDLTRIVRSDVGLSYMLLRFVKSSKSEMLQIDSINQAIRVIGREGLINLAMLLSVSGVAKPAGNACVKVQQRAMLCEKLSLQHEQVDVDAAYSMGQISGLDQIFGMEISEVLDLLPLSREVRDAILNRAGPLGEILTSACSHEVALSRLQSESDSAAMSTMDQLEQLVRSIEN